MDDRPLVVTLELDQASQQAFDLLRRTHFPPGRTAVGAHVTLFHALPGEHLDAVREDLARQADVLEQQPVLVDRVRSLGRGVAMDLRCPAVDAARGRLARAWAPWLTRQDAQTLRLHVTVANKMEPERARALLEDLSAQPLPGPATATGVGLWRYAGGPWEPVEVLPLTQPG